VSPCLSSLVRGTPSVLRGHNDQRTQWQRLCVQNSLSPDLGLRDHSASIRQQRCGDATDNQSWPTMLKYAN
jgi:hypothetical protein